MQGTDFTVSLLTVPLIASEVKLRTQKHVANISETLQHACRHTRMTELLHHLTGQQTLGS